MEKDTISQNDSYLTFKVGGENFAASVNKVLNILEMSKITKVPQAPEYMLGVINLRGQVLPVIDSRIKFGMPVSEITKNSFIIVIEVLIDEKIVQLGALVDSVNEVIEVSEEAVLPPPSIGNRYKTEFISGVINVNEEFTMLLDIDRAFSTDEIIQFQNKNENN